MKKAFVENMPPKVNMHGSAVFLMLATLLSRILGFVRIAVIGFFFGGQAQADIIHLVFSIPNNLRKLLAEGSLSTAFIPVFSQSIVQENESDSPPFAPNLAQIRAQSNSQRIIGNIFAFQICALVPIVLLSVAFPQFVLRILLNFQNAQRLSEAASLFRFIILYIAPVCLSAVLMAVLNSNNEFIIPGLIPILFSISVITSIVLLNGALGSYSVVVGVLIGGIAQFAFQIPRFRSLGFRLRLNFDFNNSEFKQILSRFIPIFISSAIFAINQQIAFRFASALDPGSSAALSNAIVFWQLPYGIFSASIITVFYPQMSKLAANGALASDTLASEVSEHNTVAQNVSKNKRLSETVESGLNSLIAFLLPATLALMLMNYEIISLALQRGRFLASDTIRAAEVLFWYSPGLVFVGLNTFLQRLCYAKGNTRLPIVNALIITVLDVCLSLWLKDTALRVRGLALANSLSFMLAFFWLLFMVNRRLIRIRIRSLIGQLLRVMLAVIPAVLIMLAGRRILGDFWQEAASVFDILGVIATALFSALSIVALYIGLKIDAVYLILKKNVDK